MDAKKFNAVVFDMDGVIFDSEKIVIDCWKIVADKHNIPNIEYACMQCLGINKKATRAKMLEIYGQDFPYDEYAAESSVIYHGIYDNRPLPMKPGVIELLSYLKMNGYKIALASSTRKGVVEKELDDAGIICFFDKIICGDMVQRSKPAPDIFLKACEEIGEKPEDCYAIEDSFNGIRSANAGGLRPIMVPDLAEPNEEISALCETVLPNLLKVCDYLKRQ